MALTQISTAGVKDDAVTAGKIPANAVGSSELADNAVDTAAIANDAVTYAKMQDVSATNRILGRDSSGAGVIEEITPANLRTMINVEDGATTDMSDTEIKNTLAAGSGLTTATYENNSVTSAKMSLTGVTAASYGSATAIPAITVDAAGRITAASTNNVNIPAGTTINNNADNRVITGSGTANTLNAESNVFVESNGRLGIGTSSPSYPLHVNSGTANSVAIFESTDAGVELEFKDSTGTSFLECHNDFRFENSSGELLRIDSSGKVIIPVGTTTRLGIADRTSGTGAGGSLLVSAGAARGSGQNTGNLLLASGRGNNSANNGVIQFGHSDGSDGTGLDSEWMRLSASGQLLVGTTSTSGVSSGADDIVIGSIGDSTSRGITFATTTDGTIRWADAGDNAMGRIQYLNNTDVMTFHTSNAERIRIAANGKVGIGNNNPDDTLDVTGTCQFSGNTYVGGDVYMYGSSYTKGLFLGGSGSANYLNDYEEGTWTPVMKDQNGNTYSGGGTITGHYVKAGEMVIVQFSGTSLGNSGMVSNQILIHGIPFTPRETAIAFAQLRYGNNISTAQFGPHVQCDANNSIGGMNKIHDNAGDIKTIDWNHMQHSSGYYGIRWTLIFRSN